MHCSNWEFSQQFFGEVYFKSNNSGNGGGSGGRSFARSDLIYPNCGKVVTSRKTAGQREMVLVVNHTRRPQISFYNGSLIILLHRLPNIWQHPPWPTTKRSASGMHLVKMLMVHGDFTGRVATRSGSIIRAIKRLLDLLIIIPTQSSIDPNRWPPLNSPRMKNVRLEMIVRILILFSWLILSYSNDSSR